MDGIERLRSTLLHSSDLATWSTAEMPDVADGGEGGYFQRVVVGEAEMLVRATVWDGQRTETSSFIAAPG